MGQPPLIQRQHFFLPFPPPLLLGMNRGAPIEDKTADVLRGPPLLVCLPPLEATPAASSHASDASASEATPAASSHADAACSYASMAPPTAFSVLTTLFGGKSEEEGDRARAFSRGLGSLVGQIREEGLVPPRRSWLSGRADRRRRVADRSLLTRLVPRGRVKGKK
jgi:hypothetical protein